MCACVCESHNLSNTSYQQTYTRSHPSLHSLRQTSPNSSFLIILLLVLVSLHTGVFPSAFSLARITPLLKKPTLNPYLLENYRPVSLLPFIAKTLEQTKSLPFSHRTTSWTATSLASEVDIPPKLPCSQLLKT